MWDHGWVREDEVGVGWAKQNIKIQLPPPTVRCEESRHGLIALVLPCASDTARRLYLTLTGCGINPLAESPTA